MASQGDEMMVVVEPKKVAKKGQFAKKEGLPALVRIALDDPNGNRTRVAALKGPCPNR